MIDSGDAAMAGVIAGGAAAYYISDGTWQAAALGSGVGLALAGGSADRILEQTVEGL